MKELEKILDEKKKQLCDEVEAEISQVDLVNKLVELYPMNHNKIDKMHIIWSRALRDVFWLGWITAAKGNRRVYDQKFCETVEQSIMLAFKIGKEYSKERL